jgi:hypothetical protein
MRNCPSGSVSATASRLKKSLLGLMLRVTSLGAIEGMSEEERTASSRKGRRSCNLLFSVVIQNLQGNI